MYNQIECMISESRIAIIVTFYLLTMNLTSHRHTFVHHSFGWIVPPIFECLDPLKNVGFIFQNRRKMIPRASQSFSQQKIGKCRVFGQKKEKPQHSRSDSTQPILKTLAQCIIWQKFSTMTMKSKGDSVSPPSMNRHFYQIKERMQATK